MITIDGGLKSAASATASSSFGVPVGMPAAAGGTVSGTGAGVSRAILVNAGNLSDSGVNILGNRAVGGAVAPDAIVERDERRRRALVRRRGGSSGPANRPGGGGLGAGGAGGRGVAAVAEGRAGRRYLHHASNISASGITLLGNRAVAGPGRRRRDRGNEVSSGGIGGAEGLKPPSARVARASALDLLTVVQPRLRSVPIGNSPGRQWVHRYNITDATGVGGTNGHPVASAPRLVERGVGLTGTNVKRVSTVKPEAAGPSRGGEGAGAARPAVAP